MLLFLGTYVFDDPEILGGALDLVTTCSWAYYNLPKIRVTQIRPARETGHGSKPSYKWLLSPMSLQVGNGSARVCTKARSAILPNGAVYLPYIVRHKYMSHRFQEPLIKELVPKVKKPFIKENTVNHPRDSYMI